ncbi:uncharacterized protein Hap1MRO34_013369 [Clarias gariepinus]
MDKKHLEHSLQILGSMYIENSRGPKTDPSGTPYFTGITSDGTPFRSTKWYRSDSTTTTNEEKLNGDKTGGASLWDGRVSSAHLLHHQKEFRSLSSEAWYCWSWIFSVLCSFRLSLLL